jgi:aspartyl-tRNA(Asn)/glutamyl-tRNA(Gln) amidotransferase subunit B
MNKRALELAAKAGLALGSHVNQVSLFSRKNYFYPDLPNGFQTSQLDPPICQGGELAITTASGAQKIVHLNRIHLEDDAGKCIHDEKRGISLIDLNRAGTPLIEIVTEPELSGSFEAVGFLKKLHSLLVRLGVTKGRMEEGEFRCDVNISLKPVGSAVLGVRGEIKNLNSFKFVGQAIDYEIQRQTALYERGQKVLQETLHFDSAKGQTRSLRSKEEAHDYRYFPQPDLPPVQVSDELLERLKGELPDPPEKILDRLVSLGLRPENGRLLLERTDAVEYFDRALGFYNEPVKVFSVMEEFFLPACHKENIGPFESLFGPEKLASLAKLMADGILGRRKVQELFSDFFTKGLDPQKELAGHAQIKDDGELMGIIKEVVSSHPKESEKYKKGEKKILSFLVGLVMKQSQGRAEPKKASELLKDYLTGKA